MRGDPASDASRRSKAANDRCGVVPLHPPLCLVEQQRTVRTAGDGLIDRLTGTRVEHDERGLVALAEHLQGGLVASATQVSDVGPAGLRHAQPVEREQADQSVGVSALVFGGRQ